MPKKFCEETIDCLVNFSICYLNSCAWNKLSTTISIKYLRKILQTMQPSNLTKMIK